MLRSEHASGPVRGVIDQYTRWPASVSALHYMVGRPMDSVGTGKSFAQTSKPIAKSGSVATTLRGAPHRRCTRCVHSVVVDEILATGASGSWDVRGGT
jgi:hypothetical protein